MAKSISQPLIRSLKTSNPSTTIPLPPRLVASSRGYASSSSQSEPPSSTQAGDSDWEAMAVQRIENAVHQIMMIKSVPDWLPFVPGGSYWVPPKRDIEGLPQLMSKIANPLSEQEYLSLTNVRGWPCASSEMEKSTSAEPQLEDLKSKGD